MKKVLVTICAMAAVLACTKTEVTFDEPGEISFAPVSRYATKAAVGNGDDFTQSFYVFANTNTENVPYFSNVLFGDTDNDGVFLGNPSQFWPNATPLKFAGVTRSGNIGTVTPEMTTWGTISVSGYEQPSPGTASTANDLMYFFVDNSGQGYTKPENNTEVNVIPVMQHACSWITIKVAADANTIYKDLDSSTEGVQSYWSNIKLYEVKIQELATNADVTFTEKPTGETKAVAWTISTTASKSENVAIYTAANGATDNVLTSTAVLLENTSNNTVVIPQTPFSVSLKYGYTTAASGSTEIVEEVKNISLATTEIASWQPGMHYTYTLVIGADEIKIQPSAASWNDDLNGDAAGKGQPADKDVK